MRINVDSKALNEGRIKRLAVLVGRPHRHVLGDLLFVWHDCYERRTAFVSELDIDAQVDVGFARSMVAVGLAEELPPGNPQGLPPGTLRVMGVADRIDWLLDSDAKRQKANETRKRNRDNKELPRGDAGGVPARVPSSPSPSPSPDLIPDLSLSPANGAPTLPTLLASGSGIHGTVPPYATADWSAAKKAVMAEVVPIHVARFNALRAELDSSVRPLQEIESVRSLRELLNGYPSFDGMTNDCKHAIAVAEAEARRTGSFTFFGESLWSPKTFGRAKRTSLDEARAGPKSTTSSSTTVQPPQPKRLTT